MVNENSGLTKLEYQESIKLLQCSQGKEKNDPKERARDCELLKMLGKNMVSILKDPLVRSFSIS